MLADGSVAWGDYDNDGDLDILLTGQYKCRYHDIQDISEIIINLNTAYLHAPTNLTSTVNGQDVTFSWNKSTDNETPQNGLKYNLVIGTTPSGNEHIISNVRSKQLDLEK